MKKHDRASKLLNLAVNHPKLFFGISKIIAILSLPYWLIIKIFGDGVYEVSIIGKENIVIKRGYIWCMDEYRYSRHKRVITDLKLRNRKDFILPEKYSLQYNRVKPDTALYYNAKLLIWTKVDFELHETPLFTFNKFAIDYPAKIADDIKGLAINQKIFPAPILVEMILLNGDDIPLAKSFIFTKNGKEAYKILKEELKKDDYAELKSNAKYVKMRYYKKETPRVIWAL